MTDGVPDGDVRTGPAEGASSVVRSSMHPLRLAVAIGAVVVALDQITKHLALGALSDGSEHHVVWTLQFNLAFNSGMAFSAGQGAGRLIGLLALVVAGVVLSMVRHAESRTVVAAAGFVAGGALGNVIDRLFRGEGWMRGRVVDFIDFQWFPIFNVADIAVNVGGGLFVVWSLFAGRASRA